MPIDFIYIDNFRNIEKQSFNISAKYKFTLTPREEENTFNLTREESPNYCGDGFFHEKISNITALIGKNGSGKSNLFYFLRYFLGQTSDFGSYTTDPYINLSDFLVVIGKVIIHRNLDVVNQEELERLGYSFLTTNQEGRIDTNGLKGTPEISSTKFIHHSLIFAARPEYPLENEIDVSTYNLCSEDSKVFYSNNVKNEFYTLISKEDFPIAKEPDSLVIRLESDIIRHYKSSSSKFNDHQNLQEAISKHFGNDRFSNVSTYTLFENLIFYWFKTYFQTDEIFNADYYKSMLESKIKPEQGEVSINEWDRFLSIYKFVENWDDMVSLGILEEHTQENYSDPEKLHFRYHFRSDNTQLKELIELHDHILKKDAIFIFFWGEGLSSGEESLLLNFGRFLRARQDLDEYLADPYVSKIENLVIIIDEGETYMHPEWQRMFISDTIEGLTTIFNEYTIQILLSSHSPIIISDLPNENIVFLDKDDEGKCLVKDSIAEEQTFAGNIYGLFRNVFFLNNSIGEFAAFKVKQVTRYLKGKESEIQSNMEAQALINLIGEPLIKNKLQTMLDERKSDEELISHYQKRIDELRAKRNDSN